MKEIRGKNKFYLLHIFYLDHLRKKYAEQARGTIRVLIFLHHFQEVMYGELLSWSHQESSRLTPDTWLSLESTYSTEIPTYGFIHIDSDIITLFPGDKIQSDAYGFMERKWRCAKWEKYIWSEIRLNRSKTRLISTCRFLPQRSITTPGKQKLNFNYYF